MNIAFKHHYMLIVNISMISHDKIFGKKSMKRVWNMFQVKRV